MTATSVQSSQELEGCPQGDDWGFPYGSGGKNPPAMQEMQVRSLGQEDPLEEGKATDSNILPGESHGERSLVRCSPWGHKESDTTVATEQALKELTDQQ